MAKEAVSPEEQALENAKNRTESFFENNSKTVIVALIAIFVLAAAIFGYRKLIVEPRMEKAQEMLYGAQYRFEEQNPDYALALNGDQSAPGFAEVVETYGGTPAGNLARYYAAACCMHLGDMAQAEQYIAKFKHVKGEPGAIINAMAEGLKGRHRRRQRRLCQSRSTLREGRQGERQRLHRAYVSAQGSPRIQGRRRRGQGQRMLRDHTHEVSLVDRRTRRREVSGSVTI